jgi:hypothetical protein
LPRTTTKSGYAAYSNLQHASMYRVWYTPTYCIIMYYVHV